MFSSTAADIVFVTAIVLNVVLKLVCTQGCHDLERLDLEDCSYVSDESCYLSVCTPQCIETAYLETEMAPNR